MENEKLTNCCYERFVAETDVCSKCKEHAGVAEAEEQTIGITGTKQSIIDSLELLKEQYGGSLTLAELIHKLENQHE